MNSSLTLIQAHTSKLALRQIGIKILGISKKQKVNLELKFRVFATDSWFWLRFALMDSDFFELLAQCFEYSGCLFDGGFECGLELIEEAECSRPAAVPVAGMRSYSSSASCDCTLT